jgi:hypothetical protein
LRRAAVPTQWAPIVLSRYIVLLELLGNLKDKTDLLMTQRRGKNILADIKNNNPNSYPPLLSHILYRYYLYGRRMVHLWPTMPKTKVVIILRKLLYLKLGVMRGILSRLGLMYPENVTARRAVLKYFINNVCSARTNN